MKTCAACHEDLPKDKFSKKQWKLNQRRCKVCISDNREVQPIENNEPSNNEVGNLLGTMNISDQMIPVSDEELFKQPPKNEEDCPICFLRMPSLSTGYKYKVCCGKAICSGCILTFALRYDNLCPFCRAPAPTKEKDRIHQIKKRMDAGDAEALFNLGRSHQMGTFGFSKDMAKALELWHQAADLGCSNAYNNIGFSYFNGEGVGRDVKKAKQYWECAAMLGHVGARYNLGAIEQNNGNLDRALKHYMISAGVGFGDSLKAIKELYTYGHATKEDYANALRSSQAYIDEIRSDQRDKAAAVDDKYQYY